MRVTLLGTGDTTGTPTVGCDCDTCEHARQRGIERTRFSVHVENTRRDESILIDFSPDFRQQFLQRDVSFPNAGIVTHIHFDHLDGLGNAYRLCDDLPIHAANETDPQTNESVAETVARKYKYLDQVTIDSHSPFEVFEICGLNVQLVPVDHPPLYCYGVVVEDPVTETKLSLSGDTSYGVPSNSQDALANPDLFLSDAIVPASMCQHHPLGGKHHNEDGIPRTFGTKHMTREGARDLAETLDADKTRLVHTGHYYPAEEAFEDPLAIDGEEYEL